MCRGYECEGVMNVYDELKDLQGGNEIPFRWAALENGDYQYGLYIPNGLYIPRI